MDSNGNLPRHGAMWWTRTPEGGVRRIWVRKASSYYYCARETCDALQEAARSRIFAAEAECKPPTPGDVQCWCQAQFAQLRTDDAAEAWDFLGGDEIARCAMAAADPALESVRLEPSTREA